MATESPKTLLEATRFFADPDVCLAAAIQLRWGTGPVTCPTCGATDPHFIATRRIWRCSQKHERRQFSVKIGTVMEDSPIGLDKWMVAIWLLANAKNGISSYELGRAVGLTQKTAWFLLHRIRLAMQSEDGGKLSGDVEADETYIGAKARNMHPGKRRRIMGPKKNRFAHFWTRSEHDRDHPVWKVSRVHNFCLHVLRRSSRASTDISPLDQTEAEAPASPVHHAIR